MVYPGVRSRFRSLQLPGLSSPVVNVLWGTLNAVVGYFLVCHVRQFHVRSIPDVLATGDSGLLMAVENEPSCSPAKLGEPVYSWWTASYGPTEARPKRNSSGNQPRL